MSDDESNERQSPTDVESIEDGWAILNECWINEYWINEFIKKHEQKLVLFGFEKGLRTKEGSRKFRETIDGILGILELIIEVSMKDRNTSDNNK